MNKTMRILKTFILFLAAAVVSGCAGGKVVSLGKDTYMVQRGGWPHMNMYALQAKCVEDANRFCAKRGLVMVPVSTVGRDGNVLANNATFKLEFMAVPTNSPLNRPVPLGPTELVK
jgi:hypothetical protein